MAQHPPPAPAFSFTIPASLASFNVPAKAYLASHDGFDGLASGALIFNSRGRLLVLQRAAHDSMPNLWEVPGGACDLEDQSILYGVAREVWEESGLTVTALVQRVGPDEDGFAFFTRRGSKICKYSFEVEVENTAKVTLDPKEHQSYRWVTEEECRSHVVQDEGSVAEIKFTTSAQEATILEGFRLRRMGQNSNNN